MLQVRHPRRAVGAQQRVAQLGRVELLERLLAVHQLRVKQACIGQLILVKRGVQILHRALGSFGVVVVGVVHVDALEGRRVREHEAIVEGVARVDVVAHGDVRKFHRNYGSHGRFVGQRVNQALADEDCVAHRGGFDRRGEQDAGVNLVSEGQVVGHLQVDHDLIEDLVLVAVGVGIERRNQARFNQPVDHVVFSLRNPCARSLQRAHILRVLAVVDRVIDLYAHVFTVARGQLQAVAPEVRLGF